MRFLTKYLATPPELKSGSRSTPRSWPRPPSTKKLDEKNEKGLEMARGEPAETTPSQLTQLSYYLIIIAHLVHCPVRHDRISSTIRPSAKPICEFQMTFPTLAPVRCMDRRSVGALGMHASKPATAGRVIRRSPRTGIGCTSLHLHLHELLPNMGKKTWFPLGPSHNPREVHTQGRECTVDAWQAFIRYVYYICICSCVCVCAWCTCVCVSLSLCLSLSLHRNQVTLP